MGIHIKITRKKAFCGCASVCKVEIDGQIECHVKNNETAEFDITSGFHNIRILDSHNTVLALGDFTAFDGKSINIEIGFNGSSGRLDTHSADIVWDSTKPSNGNAKIAIAILCTVVLFCSVFLIFIGTNKLFSNSSHNNTDESISYATTDLRSMLDELRSNALRAEETYQNQYVEITGEIKVFDSDGKYIAIVPVGASDWNFEMVSCYITDDSQKAFLLEKNIGDVVTVRGKIFSIGEIIGYSIKISKISN